MRRNALLFLCLFSVGLSAQTPRPLDIEYREAAARLIGAAMVDRAAYDRLAYLTTQIGPRLSGSRGLERAVDWVAEQMKADGLQNVRLQPVKVPHWVRGNETGLSARTLATACRTLAGTSIRGTSVRARTTMVLECWRRVKATATLREIVRLLDALGAGSIETGGGETDIGPLMRAGVPGFGLHTVNEHYFDWHHTSADTFDKVDLQDFRKCIASLSVLAYVLADMPGRL